MVLAGSAVGVILGVIAPSLEVAVNMSPAVLLP